MLALSLLSDCWEFLTRHPGLILVLIGVAGEVICDWTEMGKSKKAWAKKVSAIILVLGLAIEFIEASKVDRETAELGSTNRVLSIKMEELRSTNLLLQVKLFELEAKIQHRHITDEMRSQIIAGLKPKASSGIEVFILYPSGDSEATEFASEIDTAFAQVGVSHFLGFWTGSPMPVGVSLLSPSEQLDTGAAALRDALSNSVPILYFRGKFVPDERIQLLVGPRL